MGLLQKYPRTPHLPWSRPDETDIWMDELFSPDDIVVVTEKLDGENTSIYSDGLVHARSMDSRDHPSRHWIKGRAAYVASLMQEGVVLLGENLFAKHSIFYPELTEYFYLFGARTESHFLSYSDVQGVAEELGFKTAPEIYRGSWGDFKHEHVWPRASAFGPDCEGYVVRNVESFRIEDFRKNVAKYVRPNHVQTNKHWMHEEIQKNGLKK